MTGTHFQGNGRAILAAFWIGALGLFLLALSAVFHPASAQIPGAPQNVRATVEAETSIPAPGDTVTIAIIMDPKPGWHDYWLNPGDAGKIGRAHV